MSAITHPSIQLVHITHRSTRSVLSVNKSIASTAITDLSIDAKNPQRQDSLNFSNLSKPPKRLNLLNPLKLLNQPALPLLSFGSRLLYIASFLLFPSVVMHLCSPEQDHTTRSIVLLLPTLNTSGSSPLSSSFNRPCLTIDDVAGPFAKSQLNPVSVLDTPRPPFRRSVLYLLEAALE
jgi:hypothetical protein